MRPLKIDTWILAARPKTLWASVAPVLIGSAMAFKSGGLHIMAALSALAGAVLIQIGTNFANDYYDYHKGADATGRLGPTRAVQAGLVTPAAMKTAFMAVFALTLVPGGYLVWRAGLPLAVIGALSVLFGILYTAGPYPIGYVGLGEIFVIFFFGPVAVGGTYYVQTLTISWPVLAAGLAPGLFSVAILTVNNLRDVKSDHLAGKKTLAVRLGVTFSKFQYLLSITIACLMPVVLLAHNGRHFYSLLTAVVLPAAVPSIKTVFTSQGVVLNHVLESTGKLLLLYSLIFSIGWIL